MMPVPASAKGRARARRHPIPSLLLGLTGKEAVPEGFDFLLIVSKRYDSKGFLTR
jgi:hypothetical protein